MSLVTKPCAVVLSVCMGVGGCLLPVYSSTWCAGMASLQFMNSAPSSSSAANDMTALTILEIMNTALLLGWNLVLLDINKCPSALLQDFVLERYNASMWPARTISLDWYVRKASGCEATQSNNCLKFCIVCSVGLACWASMEVSEVSMVGSTSLA